jgi:predicted porin
MKNIAFSSASLVLLGAAGVANAQSSVTLYGLLTDSVQYVNNATPAGHSLWQLFGGNLQGNRFGLRGAEDLGGGLKAIFQLENGFDINSGNLAQGGRLFGREAWVGLTSPSWGTVTVGRDYDPLVTMIQPLTGDGYFGAPFATPGDVDNNDNSFRVDNSVTYASPKIYGFQVQAMYAFGGQVGATGAGQSWGAAAAYGNGPVSAALGYFHTDNLASSVPRTGWGGTTGAGTFNSAFPDSAGINSAYITAKSIGIASAAFQYEADSFIGNISYSNAQYRPDAASAFQSTQRYNIGRVFVGYRITPMSLVGLGYAYVKASGDASATYNQVSLGGEYAFSKRTDFYLVGAWQHAAGEQRVPFAAGTGGGLVPATASIGSYGNQASTDNQIMVSLGIRHRF